MFENTFKNIDDILYKDAGADAKEALGDVATIRSLFIELQEHLYAPLAG